MAKRGYVKKKKSTNINEKSIQETKKKALPILGPANKVNELAKQLAGSLSDFGTLSGLGPASELGELAKLSGSEINPSQFGKLIRAEEELKEHVFPNLGSAIRADELAKQLVGSLSDFDTFSGLATASELGELVKLSGGEINPNHFGKLIRAEEELKEHVFPNLGSAIRADELAKQLVGSLSDFDTFSGLATASELGELAKLSGGEINPSQFGKLVRAEEELREHVFPNLGWAIRADELAKHLGASGVSQSNFDTLSDLIPASQLDELRKLTATGISLDAFEKLTGVEEALRRNAFSQFCPEDQANEIANQLGRLGASSIFRPAEEARERARFNLGIGKSVNEFIQWKKSQDPWVEDEEVAELVDNLSGEHPDIDQAVEWLESNRDKLTPETLTTMIKTAMARGVSNYVLMLGNRRHAENRALSTEIKEIWASGKYSSRNICASEEWRSLGFNSEKTARNALNNTPDPSPWPAEGM